MIEGGDGEVAGWNIRSDASRRPSHDLNGRRVLIDAVAVEPALQQIDQISSVAAAGVEDTRPRVEASAQQLIEEIDVDVAELRPQLAADVLRCRHTVAEAGDQFGAGRPNQIHAM
jgi:hypothetical protein